MLTSFQAIRHSLLCLQFLFITYSSPNASLLMVACFRINAEDAKEEIVLDTKVVFVLEECDTKKILLDRILNMIGILFRVFRVRLVKSRKRLRNCVL